jgi:hypothetical protein
MRKRKLAVAAMIISLFMTMIPNAIVVAKEEPPSVGLQWITLNTIAMNMEYTNGQIGWSGLLSGNSNTASITANYTLYKKNSDGSYDLAHFWGGFSTTTTTYLYSTGVKITDKGTYKLVVNTTIVSTSGVSEQVTDYLEKTFT